MLIQNFFAGSPLPLSAEIIETLTSDRCIRIERIISEGQATPAEEWYDQALAEWVILLSGSAGVIFENDPEPHVMKPGDYMLIPAHCRHRVEWTDPAQKTFWLAIHFEATEGEHIL